jgi:hypothetical protein
MKRSSPIALSVIALILSNVHAFAQSNTETRPRTVAQTSAQKTKLPETASNSATGILPGPMPVDSEADKKTASLPVLMTPSVLQTRISEAQRLLKSKPMTTAMTTPSIDFVTIAAFERQTARTHLVTLSKQTS